MALSSRSGTITFLRHKTGTASLFKSKIFIDGKLVGEIKESDSLDVPVSFGAHSITLKTARNPECSFSAIISEESPVLVFPIQVTSIGKTEYCGSDFSLVRPSSPKKNRGCLVGLLIFVVLICLLLVLLISVSTGESGDPSSESTLPPQSSQIPEDQQLQEPVFSAVVGTVGSWEVSVNNFDFFETVDINLLYEYQANEGSQYCVINLTAKNIGPELDVFLPVLAYGDDTTASLEWSGYTFARSELFMSEDNFSSESLNPLVSASGDIVFEVPDEAVTSDMPLILVIKAGGESFSCPLVKQ